MAIVPFDILNSQLRNTYKVYRSRFDFNKTGYLKEEY